MNGDATIAAIATPAGQGGIGIIRISGSSSLSLLQQIFQARRSPQTESAVPSHVMRYGYIHHPDKGEVLDEVLAVYMQAPRSYTREDVVEIHCHSGHATLSRILSLVLSLGARPAEAGEFTRRAFLNGRIDLSQAEAVADLINAKASGSQRIAMAGMQGLINQEVQRLRAPLLDMKALVEVAIDFPDEDAEVLDHALLAHMLEEKVLAPLSGLIDQSDRGMILRQGARIAIYGRPNVGKSSLLNTILRQERALVTHIPGTTRDTIEEWVDFGGIACRLVDMAGIREADEPVEKMGVARAMEKLQESDLVLFMISGPDGVTADDRKLAAQIADGKKVLVTVNKIDCMEKEGRRTLGDGLPFADHVAISAKYGTNIEMLEQKIIAMLLPEKRLNEADGVCPNLRQKEALVRAKNAAEKTLNALRQGLPPVLYAIDLQECIDALGEVTGAITCNDVLDTIFSRFCIGK